jgi:DNA-binding MarR family transcriptional regulator
VAKRNHSGDVVTRRRARHDRRVTWVELTGRGADTAMSTYGEVTAQLRRLLSLLTRNEQHQLASVVKSLLRDAT